MADSASSSASAAQPINATGGNINVNQPNVLIWVIVALVAVAVGFFFLNKKGKH